MLAQVTDADEPRVKQLLLGRADPGLPNPRDERRRSAMHLAAVCNPSDAEISARWAVLELLLKPPPGLSERYPQRGAVYE